jgi:hypothetical protein
VEYEPAVLLARTVMLGQEKKPVVR